MGSSDVRCESWKRFLADHAASGLSISQWCRDHDVDKAQFYYWRKRLAPGSGVAATAEANSPRWLAVGTEPQLQAASSSLTLRVGRVAIEITAGFDRRLLSDVLGVLEARC